MPRVYKSTRKCNPTVRSLYETHSYILTNSRKFSKYIQKVNFLITIYPNLTLYYRVSRLTYEITDSDAT